MESLHLCIVIMSQCKPISRHKVTELTNCRVEFTQNCVIYKSRICLNFYFIIIIIIILIIIDIVYFTSNLLIYSRLKSYRD